MKAKDTKLSERVHELLKQRIIDRELRPHTKIDIIALQEELSVSKMPIKDAINRLCQEGLLIAQPRVGTFVAPLDRKTLEATLDTRLMIEQWTVDSIVLHIRDIDIKKLRDRLACGAQIVGNVAENEFDYQTFIKLDQEFHNDLIALCNNPIIIEMYTRLNSHMQITRAYSLRALKRSQEGQIEHEEILSAFAARDAQKAQGALKTHLMNSREGVLELVIENGQL